MEELVANLTVSPDRTEPEYCNYDEHPRFADYKNAGKVAEKQRQRRKEHLERQNRAREEWLDRHRNMEESMDTFGTHGQQQNAFALRRKRGGTKNPFKNCLMQSDWLVDIPEAQELSQWTLVPAPQGRRCLVVSQKGLTSVYYKNGGFAASFETPLPGGNAKQQNHSSLTILDCICENRIINEKYKFYVLDLLWWNAKMYTDQEFEVRQFFLRSKLDELKMENGEEEQFVPLSACPCSAEKIAEFMRNDFPYELDGLLFYYNQAHYIPEQTPLVGWLKPWMLPELLGVPVPERYTQNVPYTNSKEFIDQYNKEHGHMSSAQRNALKEIKKSE